ncbi:hypothetical protein [Chromatium okenii]|nr:hypothetical protein [Chromatium okenii]
MSAARCITASCSPTSAFPPSLKFGRGAAEICQESSTTVADD